MLKKVRTSRGLSQNQLAQQIGTSLQNIQKIEYGKTKGIQYEMLNKLCQILQCQPGDILEWVPDEELEKQSLNANPVQIQGEQMKRNAIGESPHSKSKKGSFLNVVCEFEVLESA